MLPIKPWVFPHPKLIVCVAKGCQQLQYTMSELWNKIAPLLPLMFHTMNRLHQLFTFLPNLFTYSQRCHWLIILLVYYRCSMRQVDSTWMAMWIDICCLFLFVLMFCCVCVCGLLLCTCHTWVFLFPTLQNCWLLMRCSLCRTIFPTIFTLLPFHVVVITLTYIFNISNNKICTGTG